VLVSRRLLIATTNKGKLREVAGVLAGVHDLTILSLEDLPPLPEVVEDGRTFQENAVLKAEEYSRSFTGPTLADDSGLCVDALGGAPGVGSARYGGPGLDDPGRNRHLLERISDVPDSERTARFVCALALAENGRRVAVFEGSVEGRLLREPRGEGGFGYDPLFYYEDAGCTFAELTREEKAAVSHRGRALSQFRAYILANPGVLATGS
jgi:XTP/dITP diphosphohydrolase